MKKQILYLGSQSSARQKLLDLAQITYHVLLHKSDECGINTTHSFEQYVLDIAKHKMEHIVIPKPNDLPCKSNIIFALTADTLMRTTKSKTILGKPKNRNHAKEMLTLLCKEPIELATGCCLEKKTYKHDMWQTTQKINWVTPVTLEFCVPEKQMNTYLDKTPHALKACGAGIVEEFGLNFLKNNNGSFTAIMGLPLFELREALEKIGFSN